MSQVDLGIISEKKKTRTVANLILKTISSHILIHEVRICDRVDCKDNSLLSKLLKAGAGADEDDRENTKTAAASAKTLGLMFETTFSNFNGKCSSERPLTLFLACIN
jgi:hypothetical protein